MSRVAAFSMEREYEKHGNIKPKDIQKLREWVTTQPHLPHNHITDLDLVLAYHSCNFDVELTQKKLDLNFTQRTMFSFYQNKKIDQSLKQAFNCWLVTPLATLTNKGCRPIYCQLLDPDPSRFVYNDVVRAFVMVVDLCLYEEGTISGIAVLLNLDKVTLSHLSNVDLTVAKQFFYYIQEAMFTRLREFHFLNVPSFMDVLMQMFRPFMKEAMLDVVHCHQRGGDSFEEFLPVAAIPSDAGGDGSDSTVMKENIWAKIKANEEFFQAESKKIVNESLRPGGPRTLTTFFPNVDGSFKNLEID